MEACLKAFLEKKIPGNDFVINYHIGNSFSGETYFRLVGDGNYELWSTVTEGRQKKTYSGQIKVEQVQQIVESFLDAEVWKAKHFHKKPSHDDPETSIIIGCGSQEFQVALWVSEIRESPQFAKAQQSLLTLVHILSAGEILETGQ